MLPFQKNGEHVLIILEQPSLVQRWWVQSEAIAPWGSDNTNSREKAPKNISHLDFGEWNTRNSWNTSTPEG